MALYREVKHDTVLQLHVSLSSELLVLYLISFFLFVNDSHHFHKTAFKLIKSADYFFYVFGVGFKFGRLLHLVVSVQNC